MPEILYRDIPPCANEGAQAQGEAQPYWDNALNRKEKRSGYATLEPGYWKLDGSRRILSGNPEGEGYCSCVYSDEKGEFQQPVELTVTLDKTYTATSLTLEFDSSGQEWCTRMKVQWLRDTRLLAETTAFPGHWNWTIEQNVTAFDKVKLFFYSTSKPFRFLRLDRLMIGSERTFDSSQLKNLETHTQVDISGLTLPGGTARFELVLEDEKQLIFQKNQTLRIFQKGSPVGFYYLDQAEKTGPGQYQVECVDGISILAASQTLGGLYSESPFEEIAEEIIKGELPCQVAPELKGVTLSGWIAAGTKRDALLQAAFGACALVTVDAEGTIWLKSLPKAADKVQKKQTIFQGGSVTTKNPYTQVALTASEYLAGETVEVYSGDTQPGEHLIMPEEPCLEYEIAGGKILSSGANYLIFQTETPGKVVITGVKLDCRQTRYQTSLPDVEESLGVNLLEAESTMVSPDRAMDVLQRLVEYAGQTQTVQQTVLPENLSPGDYVTTEKAFDGQLVGYVLSMTTHFTGKAVAELEILGRNVELEPEAVLCGTIFAGEG